MRARNFTFLATVAVVLSTLHAQAQVMIGNRNNIGPSVHGVPPSVTSFNFGGQPGPHGLPPSVTSLGFGNPGLRLTHPFRGNRGFGFRHRRGFGFSSPFFGDIVAVPYGYPYYGDPYDLMDPGVDDSMEEEDYRGGPTIFDRRGPGADYYGPRARDEEEDYRRGRESEPAQQQPQPEQPIQTQAPTVLVFKDGHQSEVLNYAIVGANLYELSDGRTKKVALSELDLSATEKQNDERGVDFKVPVARAN